MHINRNISYFGSRFNTLALAFDVENDWNYKNRNQISQGGRWQSSSSRGGSNLSNTEENFTKVRSGSCDYGWLCDLINRFGEGGGFDLINQCLQVKYYMVVFSLWG